VSNFFYCYRVMPFTLSNWTCECLLWLWTSTVCYTFNPTLSAICPFLYPLIQLQMFMMVCYTHTHKCYKLC
jgi:hypothetical protein